MVSVSRFFFGRPPSSPAAKLLGASKREIARQARRLGKGFACRTHPNAIGQRRVTHKRIPQHSSIGSPDSSPCPFLLESTVGVGNHVCVGWHTAGPDLRN